MQQVIQAQEELEQEGIPTNIWSVTSYNLLHKDYQEARSEGKSSYLETILENEQGHFISVSDWITLLPDSLARLFPGTFTALGTDGFGLSESREALRNYFGISSQAIIDKAKE
jgi:pyruvate dehydrogenase E1 component